MLAANLVELAAHSAPPTPIETLIARITDFHTVARTGGDPINQASAVRTATVTMEGTGFFTLACRDWMAKPAVDRTLVKFYTHFRLADKNHKRVLTTQSAGYHYAAQAQAIALAQAQAEARSQ